MIEDNAILFSLYVFIFVMAVWLFYKVRKLRSDYGRDFNETGEQK